MAVIIPALKTAKLRQEIRSGLRYLAMLDGSYRFDACVPEYQRAWWLGVARRYIEGLIKFYSY